ncbi:hypothetical protein IFU40_05555 [Microbacterium sp. CFBP 13617]|uniref:hypothetical protein n=1 Tax=Microbacterium sp. CFBP 13617 TaxID=2774035 RepID=UPI00178698F9|nr:hypothetical protein [Microbacterium sp. CFBP 13617]MBD8218102.1 hypothetical protein [Microbacterium sp. CFBP 13617]
MALDLGTLTGCSNLDDKKYDDVLDNLPGKLNVSGTAMKLAASCGGVAAALLGGQGGPQNLHVTDSLAGAVIKMDVDGTSILAEVREQIVDASEEQRSAVVTGAGGVVFS